jgi:nitric oxide reductase subunit B
MNAQLPPPQDRTTRTLVVLMLLTAAFSWAAMIYLAFETYKGAPPVPERIVSASGAEIATRDTLGEGKAAFQKAGLMDYGSLYGMGAYFGEDYTARTLTQLAAATEDALLPASGGEAGRLEARETKIRLLRGVDLTANPVVLPEAVAGAWESVRDDLAARTLGSRPEAGYTAAQSLTPAEARSLGDFLLYSALTTVAARPGSEASWTSNWPADPEVGNVPTGETMTWTVASLALMMLGIGAVLAIFRLWIEPHAAGVTPQASLVFGPLTASQKALGKFFVFVALVLLIQIGAGALIGHYYVDRESFYGLPILDWLPFNFLRAVHVQAPIVWIGIGWIATALYLAPHIGGREPRGQRLLVNLLFAAVLVIVVGAFSGSYAGLKGWIQRDWFWFGHQGLEYLELGRFWQILFFVGLAGWAGLMLRGMWPTLRSLLRLPDLLSAFRAEHLMWYSALGIAFIYMFGMIPLTGIDASFTIQDYWRWWVVHLWVEWAFELFAVAVTAYFLMAIGLVSRALAERVILFEWILILGSGILGTGHHLFWAGEPPVWISTGSVFSFLEVLPLYLLVLEAIDQRQRIAGKKAFSFHLAFLFILGSAFWNFVGAGVFGGMVNAPLINYYEHATFLTMNHAHTALFGAFGMLAIGLIYLALRHMVGERAGWSDRLGTWAFWLYNAGLVLWVVLTFLPVGFSQLAVAFDQSYDAARSIAFYDTTLTWQWLRMIGDVVFAAGAVLMALDFIIKVRAGLRKGKA